jgi:coatomer subunit beta'
MLEEALEIATDADYKFDLAVQLGKLEVAKVLVILSLIFF